MALHEARGVWLSGTNLRLPLLTFIPALLAYIKSSSARNMGKLLKCNKNLNTNFPSRPTIEAEM
jgi:hypothetical protein